MKDYKTIIMKTTLLMIAAFITLNTFAQKADSAYSIVGSFTKVKSGKIFLGTATKTDSAKITNGKFVFKGHVTAPSQAFLYYKSKEGESRNGLLFYIEPLLITLSGTGDSLKDLKISGSLLNNDDKVMQGMMKEVNKWEERNSNLFDEAYKNKNISVMDSLDLVDMDVMKTRRSIVAAFVKKHPASLRGAIAIQENFSYYAEASDVEPLYNNLTPKVKSTPTGKSIKKMLDVYKTIAIGQKAPDIVETDTLGHPLALSSVKGKVVMVDFWASWCGPCRRENPNIVKAYSQFHAKGFEIFGVSYDTQKGITKWKKAINDDKLSWYQVSDLKGWSNSTSDQFYIKAIPANILLDSNGKIIARNLFGEKLIAKLNELLPGGTQ